MSVEQRPILARAPSPQTVLFCGKCARKLGSDGKAIRKGLKHALKSQRWGEVRIVETKCFSLCPKRRLVLASARTIAQGKLLVVSQGLTADAALETLLSRVSNG